MTVICVCEILHISSWRYGRIVTLFWCINDDCNLWATKNYKTQQMHEKFEKVMKPYKHLLLHFEVTRRLYLLWS
jgi:hypothetical protein